MTGEVLVMARGLAAAYRQRLVFHDVAFELRAGQALGVVGPNGAGKTTLLRSLVGLVPPHAGEVRIGGVVPREALRRTPVAYFAGEATLPGSVRAQDWGALSGGQVSHDRRRMRVLSRGDRQLLGLRTALGRVQARLVVLDEPWEGLDPDGCRWLTSAIETKRDRGAGIVVSSHRLHDLAGLCDLYLFLLHGRSTLRRAHEICAVGPVTSTVLADEFDRLRYGSG